MGQVERATTGELDVIIVVLVHEMFKVVVVCPITDRLVGGPGGTGVGRGEEHEGERKRDWREGKGLERGKGIGEREKDWREGRVY